MPDKRALRARVNAQQERTEWALAKARTAMLVAANEQLVLAILQAQRSHAEAAKMLVSITRSAKLDTLTELPNRLLLLDRFAQAMANGRRHGTKVALLFVDLNDFKQINDRFGHGVGDAVLKMVAQCLSRSVRASDTVSRYGGDEFLVVLSDVNSIDDAGQVANTVLTMLKSPQCVGGQDLQIGASIGVALFPDDGQIAEELIAQADSAMYRGKLHHGQSAVYHGSTRLPLQPATDSATPLHHPVADRASDSAAHSRRSPSRVESAHFGNP